MKTFAIAVLSIMMSVSAYTQTGSVTITLLTGDSLDMIYPGKPFQSPKLGVFVPWTFHELTEQHLDMEELAVKDARVLSGELTLQKKENYQLRQSLDACKEESKVSTSMNSVKDGKITSLESDVDYWQKQFKVQKVKTGFWKLATVVVTAAGGYYIVTH